MWILIGLLISGFLMAYNIHTDQLGWAIPHGIIFGWQLRGLVEVLTN